MEEVFLIVFEDGSVKNLEKKIITISVPKTYDCYVRLELLISYLIVLENAV